MVVWFTGKPRFKANMWPTGFSNAVFFLGGHFFERLPGRWKSNGWDRRCFLFIQIAWWIYPGGRVIHRPWSRQNVERDLGCFQVLGTKKKDFSQMLMVQNFRFFLHHFNCSEKTLTTTFDYLRVCLIHRRWSSLDIWTINTQVLRKIPVEYTIITVLDPKGIVVFPKKPDFEDEFAMGKVLGIPPDHWMFIETSNIEVHPCYMWFWPPPLVNVVFDDVEKNTLCGFSRCPICLFFRSVFRSCNTWWYQQPRVRGSWSPHWKKFMNFHFNQSPPSLSGKLIGKNMSWKNISL